MSFFTIVLRGLLRRPVRTGLTLLGISIGIAAVVALVGISRGFEKSWTDGMKTRGTDIVVNSMGSSITPKPFDAVAAERIKTLPGIATTASLLVDFMSVETADMMIVSAREWGAFNWGNLKLVEGRMPENATERAVVLGTNAAEVLKKKIGDPLQLETEELTVVGIVGVLGVTNTMMMTVFERKQEICILLAIGWRRLRIMRMILMESALLGLFGGIGGVILGAVGVQFLEKAPAIRGLLASDVSAALLITSVGIAVVVGVLSGLYPAWRSSRLSPSLALQG